MDTDHHDPTWFRPPSRREHWMAFGLFAGFGIFFILLFLLQRGSWFRWVLLSLGLISLYNGMRHVRSACRARS